KMMFSFAVLLHVHPDELNEYAGNVMTIIGKQGQYITDANLMDGETVQYSGRSWAHSQEAFEKLLAEHGGKMEILEEGKFKMEGLGKVAKRYILRIVHQDYAAA
ncbi:MAG: hypothetical protein MUP20_04390, partial [Methyloceanibacter sp.]|nr:hypothetical protein [Methyloceanibacter sp.]